MSADELAGFVAAVLRDGVVANLRADLARLEAVKEELEKKNRKLENMTTRFQDGSWLPIRFVKPVATGATPDDLGAPAEVVYENFVHTGNELEHEYFFFDLANPIGLFDLLESEIIIGERSHGGIVRHFSCQERFTDGKVIFIYEDDGLIKSLEVTLVDASMEPVDVIEGEDFDLNRLDGYYVSELHGHVDYGAAFDLVHNS